MLNKLRGIKKIITNLKNNKSIAKLKLKYDVILGRLETLGIDRGKLCTICILIILSIASISIVSSLNRQKERKMFEVVSEEVAFMDDVYTLADNYYSLIVDDWKNAKIDIQTVVKESVKQNIKLQQDMTNLYSKSSIYLDKQYKVSEEINYEISLLRENLDKLVTVVINPMGYVDFKEYEFGYKKYQEKCLDSFKYFNVR